MMLNYKYELALMESDIRIAVQKKVDDIYARIDKGIYATEHDVTAATLWEKLRKMQDGEIYDFGMFAIIAELQNRKQAGGI